MDYRSVGWEKIVSVSIKVVQKILCAMGLGGLTNEYEKESFG